MREVPFEPVAVAPYARVFGAQRTARLREAAAEAGSVLAGRTIWNVNSTSAGGGVAELLHAFGPLAYSLGADVRWLVVDGDAEFFAITKRLCTRMYGAEGDGGPLGPEQDRHYRAVLAANAAELGSRVRPGDLVIVHEAHPAGLIEAAKAMGAITVYRCHTGSDTPNEHTRDGAAFLRPHVEPADATVFLTRRHVLDWAPHPHVIPPSIDPCGPKNLVLTPDQAATILAGAGVLAGPAGSAPPQVTVPAPFGGPIRLRRQAFVVRDGQPPAPGTPMVVQVSRWDRLKDMAGVLRAFVEAAVPDSYLTLAGADVLGVADDPEAAEMFQECEAAWAALPPPDRARVQLVCLPMADPRENAILVNALQQHASVVVQKSLAEGFGLTATEAMWKSRPLVASAVGGLAEQVVPGESGLLVADAHDIAATAASIRSLLLDRDLAARLGDGAHRRIAENFLPDAHLLAWTRLINDVVGMKVA
ncbi:MAG TPA: glycosyltransferase [Pseudonocardiaceae bacterium]|jgi:trehalose synthase